MRENNGNKTYICQYKRQRCENPLVSLISVDRCHGDIVFTKKYITYDLLESRETCNIESVVKFFRGKFARY